MAPGIHQISLLVLSSNQTCCIYMVGGGDKISYGFASGAHKSLHATASKSEGEKVMIALGIISDI